MSDNSLVAGFLQNFVLEEASGVDPREMLEQMTAKGVSQALCINDLGEPPNQPTRGAGGVG